MTDFLALICASSMLVSLLVGVGARSTPNCGITAIVSLGSLGSLCVLCSSMSAEKVAPTGTLAVNPK